MMFLASALFNPPKQVKILLAILRAKSPQRAVAFPVPLLVILFVRIFSVAEEEELLFHPRC